MTMNDIYAVTGNPIFHSRSPVIFNAAFRALTLDAAYVRLAAFTAEEALMTAREIGIKGLNITSPFKSEVVPLLDEAEPNARKIESVNVVVARNKKFVGYNTDLAGVTGALKECDFQPKGKKAVVLGAGGAGRAATLALTAVGARVVLVNRTARKAEEAAHVLGCDALPIERISEAIEGAHLLVSCISSSGRLISPSLLSRRLTVLDATYGHPTALLRDAANAGCRLIDGRLWLLHQALPAFTLLTGRAAPAAQMRKALFKRRWPLHKNVALIGFMGAGKTTVAQQIAGLSGLTFVDTDQALEARSGLAVSSIFETRGEAAFRMMEQEELHGLWDTSEAVVSCGGGAVLSKRNRRVLRSRCIPVWLWADIDTALSRVREEETRPLLAGDDRAARARALLDERLFLYASTSDLVIQTRGKTPREIAMRIWNEVRQAFDN